MHCESTLTACSLENREQVLKYFALSLDLSSSCAVTASKTAISIICNDRKQPHARQSIYIYIYILSCVIRQIYAWPDYWDQVSPWSDLHYGMRTRRQLDYHQTGLDLLSGACTTERYISKFVLSLILFCACDLIQEREREREKVCCYIVCNLYRTIFTTHTQTPGCLHLYCALTL